MRNELCCDVNDDLVYIDIIGCCISDCKIPFQRVISTFQNFRSSQGVAIKCYSPKCHKLNHTSTCSSSSLSDGICMPRRK